MVLKLECALPGGTMLGSVPRVSDSVSLKWAEIIYIPNKLPGDSDTPGRRPYVEYH